MQLRPSYAAYKASERQRAGQAAPDRPLVIIFAQWPLLALTSASANFPLSPPQSTDAVFLLLFAYHDSLMWPFLNCFNWTLSFPFSFSSALLKLMYSCIAKGWLRSYLMLMLCPFPSKFCSAQSKWTLNWNIAWRFIRKKEILFACFKVAPAL